MGILITCATRGTPFYSLWLYELGLLGCTVTHQIQRKQKHSLTTIPTHPSGETPILYLIVESAEVGLESCFWGTYSTGY